MFFLVFMDFYIAILGTWKYLLIYQLIHVWELADCDQEMYKELIFSKVYLNP